MIKTHMFVCVYKILKEQTYILKTKRKGSVLGAYTWYMIYFFFMPDSFW